MRYIDNRAIERRLPQGWRVRAERALAEVRDADPDDRANAISRHQAVWAELKPILRALSDGKCWYCEAREYRSDAAIDHYRPKNRVVEDPEHPGYWWLAFNWRNYRYSCTYCNSRRRDIATGRTGGKHDHFPLIDPEARVGPEGAGDGEQPCLLDPTCAADTILLYFRDDGMVEPRHAGSQTTAERRALISIELYHLFNGDLVDARIELVNDLRELVDLGSVFFTRWMAGEEAAHAAFNLVVSKLKRRLSPVAEFSAAAKDIVRGLRKDEQPWIDLLL